MTRDEILRTLCSYDPRNPGSAMLMSMMGERPEPGAKDCSCDNCFYGRHKLAVELLRQRDELPPLMAWVQAKRSREVIISPGYGLGDWVNVQMIDGADCVTHAFRCDKPQEFEVKAVELADSQFTRSRS
jgi:hypothetical protein